MKKWILWIPVIGFIYSIRLIKKEFWYDKIFNYNIDSYIYWEAYQIVSLLILGMLILKIFV